MSRNLIDELNQLARPIALPAGSVLFRCGECGSAVYVVRSGKIALLWPGAKETQAMEVVAAGSIVGLPAALNGTYSLTARTMVDSELGCVSTERVIELLECHPPLCLAATRIVGQEVARMRSLLAEMVSGCLEPPARNHR